MKVEKKNESPVRYVHYFLNFFADYQVCHFVRETTIVFIGIPVRILNNLTNDYRMNTLKRVVE